MAERAGIGLGTLNRLMSGVIPTDATLKTIEKNLGITVLASYDMVASEDLGAYPKAWCDDLHGDYLSIRQNRWMGKTDVINTYPVSFAWDTQKPGLRMEWSAQVDRHHTRRQSAYVSMTSRDGLLTIISNSSGRISTTQLQRFDHSPNRLFGIYCGLGEVGRGHEAIVAQVVAYVRLSEIDFSHDAQIMPGRSGHQEFSAMLGSIEGAFCFMLEPPQ